MKSLSQHYFLSLTAAVLMCAAFGCGGAVDRPTTHPVTGTVMYKGEPVEGASVAFWTDGAPRAAKGVTNAEGKFQLSMFDANDGAIPGEATITVTKMEPGTPAAGGPSPEDMLNDPLALTKMAGEGGAGQKGPKSLIPAKYGDRKTTPLKETVADGENQFVLQLTD